MNDPAGLTRATGRKPRIGFAIEQVLGHVAYTMNLREAFASRSDFEAVWLDVPFEAGGAARWPLVRNNWALRGSLLARRMIAEAHRERPLDALFIHTPSISLLSAGHMRRIPTLLSLDATPRNIDAFGAAYGHAVHGRAIERLKAVLYRRVMSRAAAYTTWSHWAMRSLTEDYGAPPERVSVVYPGIQLSGAARPRDARTQERPRILFVGGDLERKGGGLLIETYRRAFADACDLHIVTNAAVAPAEGIHVHRGVTPNSPALRALYAGSDIFVLPTRGDCLALVIGEAMAAGLPVITTRGAGHSEAVEDGASGFLIDIDDGAALTDRLRALVVDEGLRRRMGERGRAIAEARLDVRRTADALTRILMSIATAGASEAIALGHEPEGDMSAAIAIDALPADAAPDARDRSLAGAIDRP